MRKALALISTGLDSLLAAALVKKLGIEVEGICFVMQFDNLAQAAERGGVEQAAREIDVPITVVDISENVPC